MATVQSALRDALDNLRGADLKRFRSHLLDKGDIARGRLEKADADDIVELMVDKYKKDRAGTVTLAILRDMKENDIAEGLENALREVGVCVDTGLPSAQLGQPGGQGSAHMSAQSGGSVKAHTIAGCKFDGPVTFS
ncbi:hypothetical protein ACEWY4_017407 [Coilia grayii]|uniref:Pyrin domain-containing protein n=1 Tax=Coilia grayii TaxID=363190 RepID=A0ABD1JGR0_9TELE